MSPGSLHWLAMTGDATGLKAKLEVGHWAHSLASLCVGRAAGFRAGVARARVSRRGWLALRGIARCIHLDIRIHLATVQLSTTHSRRRPCHVPQKLPEFGEKDIGRF